ncbi:MAG TPA: hypothetical protein VMU53_13320 [Candidatus Sulfotelmatobacter sp.]|nr:hypothetical protein [Candidatus Sulfotelmatobacter sp.]
MIQRDVNDRQTIIWFDASLIGQKKKPVRGNSNFRDEPVIFQQTKEWRLTHLRSHSACFVWILGHSQGVEQSLDLAIYVPTLENVLLAKFGPQQENIQAASQSHFVSDQRNELEACPPPPLSCGFDPKFKSFLISYGIRSLVHSTWIFIAPTFGQFPEIFFSTPQKAELRVKTAPNRVLFRRSALVTGRQQFPFVE